MSTTSIRTSRPSDALTRNQRLEMYYFARLARDIEERLVILFRQSKVIGGLYRSLGQEGESVGTAYALERTDAVLPLIRNMGALMTMGVRPKEIFLQYMARDESNTRGRDLNIHIVNLPPDGVEEPVVVGPISMLGDSISVAAGIAMGARMRGKDLVAMAWIGDGATSTGSFHEGLNFAAVQKIPLVVVAEDNKYAYSTPISRQMAIEQIDERAAAYGIPHEMVDGNDILAVYDLAKRMVDRARSGAGASLIGVDTMRMQGHAQHDDARYVPKELMDRWSARDPIALYRRQLIETGTAKEKELDDIDRMTKSYAAEEADLAEKSPMPDPATVTRGVYAGDDFAVPRVELVRSPFAAR
ncbi:MAG TPA: thiamine pyrophosphate-dependent dehydrogenase E1 component subunit alpha [Vicinamibacterales bacterium]|nr:thiamine pyrophosphate-dependent dehydrogenase E1 component subunit alpha [Vicinamibacterales bacterium]